MCENVDKEKESKKKKARINKQKKVLNDLFKDLNDDVKNTVDSLIDNIAFMKVTLEDLQIHINLNGVKEEYQNGANQKGYKKSTEAEMYNAMFKNFNMAMKTLIDYLPKTKSDDEDGFDDFRNEINS